MKLLEKFVMLKFILHTSNIKLAELLYISIKTRPGITIANKFQCFILTKVASKNIIVIILEYICRNYQQMVHRFCYQYKEDC